MTPISSNSTDDDFQLLDDESTITSRQMGLPWRILLVDDDEEVHQTTLFALSDVLILGHPLELLHAYSANEASTILATNRDITVIFLDVVMEQEDSGLKLIKVIRDELELKELRIILRTGQPGYAPELEVISNYDINDYRTKSELTHTRLVTSLTSAIRSYQQICALATSRQGLEKIVLATSELYEKRALESMAEGVLTQIAGLLGYSTNGVVCAQRGFPLNGSDNGHLYVVGAAGCYAQVINCPLEDLGNDKIEASIRSAITHKTSIYADDYTVLYLNSKEREEAIFLDSEEKLESVDQQLLEVFAANISVGFANVYFFQQLKFLAYNDLLTGLPNRRGLDGILTTALKRENGQTFLVILADIDHFADINDVLGSAFGDLAVSAVAERVRLSFPLSIHVGRYSADTLCVIGDPATVQPETIISLFAEPFQILSYSLPLTVTLGVCPSTASLDATELLNYAGLALSRAKQGLRGHYQWYSSHMAIDSQRRLELLQALRLAVSDRKLELHYQPFIDLVTGAVVGAEALLRWRGEDGKMISPVEFIPIAEQSGLILGLGRWVIEEACRQLAEWNDQGLGRLRIAVNVSAIQLRRADFGFQLSEALRIHALNAGQIELEITESMIIEDIDAVVNQLKGLKELGVAISVDDFGTGFSSLSYLQQLPIDTLKVDRAFIRDIGSGNQGERIGEMIVGLAKILDLQTVAEGIETEQQAQIARSWHCTTGQGFLYSPALAPDDFKRWVMLRADKTSKNL